MATYITVDELRAHLGESAADLPVGVLTDYIDALEEEIDTRFGPLGPVSVRLTPAPQSEYLVARRRIGSIVSIVELDAGPIEGQTFHTLDPLDYALRSPYIIERLGTGPWPATFWSAFGVDLTYIPLDDSARRKLAIADVAKLEAATIGLGTTGGVSVRIGDYAETIGGSGAVDAVKLERDRNAILGRLRHRKVVIA